MIYTGIPSPEHMPQQQMVLPPALPPSEMVIDVLGVRVPAEMLHSGAFWAFLVVASVTVLSVAWMKYRKSGE
jgi:hypothetical protein